MPVLAPGIVHIAASKSSNSFLVDGDGGLTLVDAGSGKASIRCCARSPSRAGTPPT